MHCSDCGSYVAPGVRFCSQCGSPALDPEATRIARPQSGLPAEIDNGEVERTVFSVRPTLIFVKLGYAAAVLAAIALIALLAYLTVPAVISVPVALALLL